MTPEEAATELMKKLYPRQPTGGAVEHEILHFIRAAVAETRRKDAEIARQVTVSANWHGPIRPTGEAKIVANAIADAIEAQS